MNTDITKRLRDRSKCWCKDHKVVVCDECSERAAAADEIERLRGAWLALEGRIDALRDFNEHYRAAIDRAISELENPYLTLGGVARAMSELRKAVGR